MQSLLLDLNFCLDFFLFGFFCFHVKMREKRKGEIFFLVNVDSFLQCSDTFLVAAMLKAVYIVIGCLYYLLCAQAFIFCYFAQQFMELSKKPFWNWSLLLLRFVFFFRFAKRTSFYGCLGWPWRNAEKLYMWNRFSFECNDTTTCSINTNAVFFAETPKRINVIITHTHTQKQQPTNEPNQTKRNPNVSRI